MRNAKQILTLTVLVLAGGCGNSSNDPPSTYFVGGTVSGLTGTVVLQNSGSGNLSVTGNGPFSFVAKQTAGTAYAVTVFAQPTDPWQTCLVSGGTGAVGAADVTTVTVTCTDDSPRIAFVTSVFGNGQLSSWTGAGAAVGLAAADAVCQARATAAGLSGTFVAWLSSSTSDAYCRIHGLPGLYSANCGQAALPTGAGPWVRTDGFAFMDALPATTALYTPPIYDESGVIPAGATSGMGLKLLTNTARSGAPASLSATCTDWTDGVAATGITTGGTGETVWWSNSSTGYCNDATVRLLCFERGAGNPLPSFATTGKHVFATSTAGTGNLSTWADAGGQTGLAAGDKICQARATAAGLANPTTYKAWLSTFSINAVDRLTSVGPWVRLDGVVIADSKADLTDGVLFTAVTFNEYGVGNDTFLYTGTAATGLSSGFTCVNWTSAGAGDAAHKGRQDFATSRWTDDGTMACSTSGRLICFED
jgi:hypothetical protein